MIIKQNRNNILSLSSYLGIAILYYAEYVLIGDLSALNPSTLTRWLLGIAGIGPFIILLILGIYFSLRAQKNFEVKWISIALLAIGLLSSMFLVLWLLVEV